MLHAVTRKPVCTLVAYGFKTRAVRAVAPLDLLQQFRRDNTLKIIEVREPAKRRRREDEKTTLLVAIEDADTANMLCERGICWEYGNYPYTPFSPKA